MDLAAQIDLDQKRYSRYVCDSRAIPNVIDGLKPVQRRILWTMWKSNARETFTKTVKVAGMVMGYHPHGNVSIEDAIAQMVQAFPFANNYPLIEGEGTFGDVLDPKAIASSRYTEVRLSQFAKDVGFFDSLDDIDYVSNYDETAEEPIFFIPKIPVVFLNPILGIATGFKCWMPSRRLADVGNAVITALRASSRAKTPPILPWIRDYAGTQITERNDQDMLVLRTGFGFTYEGSRVFLTDVPHNWNREKTVVYLEQIIKDSEGLLRDYEDDSKSRFRIELLFKRGSFNKRKFVEKTFVKETRDIIDQNVIMSTGELRNTSDAEIIDDFLRVRRAHLQRRFARLEALESERIARESELIRFIAEKWNERLTQIASRESLLKELRSAKFVYGEWLGGLPLYRLTKKEAERAEKQIAEARKQQILYKRLKEQRRALNTFMQNEIEALMQRWNP